MAVRLIEEIKDIVRKYYNLLLVSGMPVEKSVLFGSYARNEQKEESDIDIAVVMKKYLICRFNTRLELMKYARVFDEVIEPHPFLLSEFNHSNPFASEIIANGEVFCS